MIQQGLLHEPRARHLLDDRRASCIGTLGAFALDRFQFRTKNLWDGLNYMKIIIAEVVAGVSTLLFFVQLNEFLDKYLGFNFWRHLPARGSTRC